MLDLLIGLERLARGVQGDSRCPLDREAVDAGRDRWEGNRAAAELGRHLERAPVARGEELVLTRPSALPDRPHCVDDVTRQKIAGGGRLRVAGLAAAEQPAFLQDRGPTAAMDGPVHTAAPEQRRVRGVHDRVDLLGRNVALRERYSFRFGHTITVSEAIGSRAMLSYEDVGGAADWLVNAFGFEESDRIEDNGEAVHVELRLGAGVVMLGKPGATYVNPKRLRERCDAAAEMYSVPWVIDGVWAQVDNLDTHLERAREAGARLLSEIEDGPDGQLYRVEDHEGHRWMFAQAQ